jgi:hypothetical protein
VNFKIGFIYQFNGKAIPIEVKSGEGSRLKSLHLFMEKSPHNIAVRVWSAPMAVDQITIPSGKKVMLINIPFYLIHRLPQILRQYS